MDRKPPFNVKIGDRLTCIKDYLQYKKGNKYKVTAIDPEGFVCIENNTQWFEKINKLYELLKEIETNPNQDVVNVLKFTISYKESEVYLEDVFGSLKEERKKKLAKIFGEK